MSEIYLYDEIVSEKYTDWGGNEHGIAPSDIADVLHQAENGETVDVFVNSPGGSVFAAVAMASEIKRAIQRGVTVNAYVDGIAASAASFLIMACSSVNMYEGTMLMVHKPMSFCWGNADDMMKTAEDLESIQEGTCMPAYRSKLKGDEEELKALIAKESWISAKQAAEMFNITICEERKDAKDSLDPNVIAKFGYRNVPEQLIKREKPEEAPAIDYSEYEQRISKL